MFLYTYILVGCLIASRQIGMEAGQADHRPYREEANEHNNHSEGRRLDYIKDLVLLLHHCRWYKQIISFISHMDCYSVVLT